MVELKQRIGEHMLRLRAGRKQEVIERESGVHRTIIGKIERGSTDYRINSLIKVLIALKASEETLFPDDPLEEALRKKLITVLRRGKPEDRNYLISTIERAAAGLIDIQEESPPRKASRSA